MVEIRDNVFLQEETQQSNDRFSVAMHYSIVMPAEEAWIIHRFC